MVERAGAERLSGRGTLGPLGDAEYIDVAYDIWRRDLWHVEHMADGTRSEGWTGSQLKGAVVVEGRVPIWVANPGGRELALVLESGERAHCYIRKGAPEGGRVELSFLGPLGAR